MAGRRWERWLASRWTLAAAAALAIALTWPAVGTGFASDDWFLVLAHRPELAAPGVSATPGTLVPPGGAAAGIEAGVLAWTTSPDFSLSFFRPLAMATHALDFALWPTRPGWMHAHSLLWAGALVAAAGALYRRLHGPGPVAGLALLLLAVEDARAPAAGWIANRNALIAALFAVGCVWAHDRWRRDGWGPGAVWGPGLLLLGLASSEAAFGACGLLFAHAAFLDGRRWRALAGPFAAAAAWLGLWAAGGYGVRGSWVYADPSADPLGAALHAARNASILLAAQLSGLWSELACVPPPEGLGAIAAACAAWLALAALALRPALATPEGRFWGVGGALAAVPVALSFPSDRVLVLVSVAAAPLVASLLLAPWPRGPARWWRGAWVIGLAAMHLALSVPATLARARGMEDIEAVFARASAALPADPGVTGRTVVLLNPPSDAVSSFVATRRAAYGEPIPAALRSLATTLAEVRVERVDAHTLRLTPSRGWLDGFGERLLRDVGTEPFRAGDRLSLPDVEVVVERVLDDGRPAVARFRFPVPLEDPSIDWFAWEGIAPAPWAPPAVGEAVSVGPIDALAVLEGRAPEAPAADSRTPTAPTR